MKHVFSVLVTVSIALTANAQENNNALFSSPGGKTWSTGALNAISDLQATQLRAISPVAHHSGSAQKTTGGPYPDWYDMWGQNTSISGGSLVSPAVEYYFPIYPDSSLYDDYGTSASYVGWHGMGQSFDPTDSGYSLPPLGTALYLGVGTTMKPVGQAYTIDSFSVPIQYKRHNPIATVVDSVIIEIVVTAEPVTGAIDSGSYNIKFAANPAFYPIAHDETPRYGALRYSPGGAWDPVPYNGAPYVNDCYFDSVFTYKQRYAIPLTGASTDTDANGYVYLDQVGHAYNLPLSPAIYIPSSQVHAVSFVSFKSGQAYAFGTHTSVANIIHCFAGEPNGLTNQFRQSSSNPSMVPASYPGSYQAGVWANNQLKYLHNGAIDTGFTVLAGKPHDELIPGFAFNAGVSVPVMGWHIKWSGLDITTLGVEHISKTISDVTAYPNPASDELNIQFTLAQEADATVSLINIVGQTVAIRPMGNITTGKAVFSTAGLPDGVYIYSIQANGERTTGRVAVQH